MAPSQHHIYLYPAATYGASRCHTLPQSAKNPKTILSMILPESVGLSYASLFLSWFCFSRAHPIHISFSFYHLVRHNASQRSGSLPEYACMNPLLKAQALPYGRACALLMLKSFIADPGLIRLMIWDAKRLLHHAHFISLSSKGSPHSGQNFGGFLGSAGLKPHLSH